MRIWDSIVNSTMNRKRYRTRSDAVIISCFFNPMNNPYRLLAFQKWYRSIKHLNHRIVECLFKRKDARFHSNPALLYEEPQLPESPFISHAIAEDVLFHKEALLNNLIRELPPEYQYVFWVDADVLFTNLDWLVQGCEVMERGANIIQPFEWCFHLERNQIKPNVDGSYRGNTWSSQQARKFSKDGVWRSFAANSVTWPNYCHDDDYDIHGHVGFAWGARRETLEACPLYDKALIGGADHIMAHAAAGHVPHPCIDRAFADDIVEVTSYMKRFYEATQGKVGYVPGDLYHLWHGDLKKRNYLNQIKQYTSVGRNAKKGALGLYEGDDKAVRKHMREKEDVEVDYTGDGCDLDFGDLYNAGEFLADMGYALYDLVASRSPSAPEPYDPSSPRYDGTGVNPEPAQQTVPDAADSRPEPQSFEQTVPDPPPQTENFS